MRLAFCYNCSWEGADKDLVEKPGDLIFYDYLAKDQLGMDINRVNHVCPKCGTILKSHRISNGMVFDQ